MNQTNKNNLPLHAEEQILEQEQQEQNKTQEILNRYKQPIPKGFVELKVEEGNYICSTNPKWKDKSLCERYGFYSVKGEWIQIDIPHELVKDLELEKDKDIIYPLYLSPDRAITIENKNEIFLDKPVSEKNVEQELIKRLDELNNLRKK